MHFCTQCSNMYYISINPEQPDQLMYYCRNCGHTDTTISATNVTVCKAQLKKSQQEFSHIINKYTKLDPTLPRVSNILCPNPECPTNNSKAKVDREIIYIRYDDKDMKYVYLCSTCDTVWQPEEKS